jgi:hypothetical protein
MTTTNPVMNAAPTDAGFALYQRFLTLGDLQGKTIQEVVRSVGQPSASTPRVNGGRMLEWKAGSYSVELEFDKYSRFVQLKPSESAAAAKPYETVLKPGITVVSSGHSMGARVLRFVVTIAAVIAIKLLVMVVLGQVFK